MHEEEECQVGYSDRVMSKREFEERSALIVEKNAALKLLAERSIVIEFLFVATHCYMSLRIATCGYTLLRVERWED